MSVTGMTNCYRDVGTKQTLSHHCLGTKMLIRLVCVMVLGGEYLTDGEMVFGKAAH